MKCALCEKRIGMFDKSKDYPIVIEDETFQVRCHEQCWTDHVKRILEKREEGSDKKSANDETMSEEEFNDIMEKLKPEMMRVIKKACMKNEPKRKRIVSKKALKTFFGTGKREKVMNKLIEDLK